jgi:hypothetical protein
MRGGDQTGAGCPNEHQLLTVTRSLLEIALPTDRGIPARVRLPVNDFRLTQAFTSGASRTLHVTAVSPDQIIRVSNLAPTGFPAVEDVDEIHRNFGAANGTRTRDPKIHNLVL